MYVHVREVRWEREILVFSHLNPYIGSLSGSFESIPQGRNRSLANARLRNGFVLVTLHKIGFILSSGSISSPSSFKFEMECDCQMVVLGGYASFEFRGHLTTPESMYLCTLHSTRCTGQRSGETDR